LTIQEYITKLTESINSFDEDTNNAINIGGEELNSQLKNRVFNENVDIAGSGFGGYSENYKAFRLALGGDISKKNLQLTMRMRRGIGYDKESKSLKFQDVEDAIKGRKNEDFLNQRIFEASVEETEIVISVIEEEYNKTQFDRLN